MGVTDSLAAFRSSQDSLERERATVSFCEKHAYGPAFYCRYDILVFFKIEVAFWCTMSYGFKGVWIN